MKYCKKCLMPNTRPGLKFENGVCVACLNYEKQSSTNWNERKNELKNGDMRFAPEALRLVNSIYTKSKKIKEVEIGKIYGNSEDRTLRVIHNEALLHPFQPYNKEATSNQIAFFEKVFNFNPKIDNMNQIWPWKEFFGLVALITALVSIIPMTRQLLTYSFFKSTQWPNKYFF